MVTEEQLALRDAVRGFVRQHGTSAQVRRTIDAGQSYDPELWKRLSGELGLAGLAVPESLGGAGGSLAEVAIVVAELGRALLPSPYLSTAAVASVLAVAGETEVLSELAAGTMLGTFAVAGRVTRYGNLLRGTASCVLDGTTADVLLVGMDDELFLVRAADATVTANPTIDPTRSVAMVSFDDVPARAVGRRGLATFAEDVVRALLAVECVGAAERALELTVDYLKTRQQFGVPIGSFQALKHRCADLAVANTAARAMAEEAVAAVGIADFAVVAPAAKLLCAQSFLRTAGEMIQLHGGIGFTWEHDAHLFFRRAKLNEQVFGTPSQLRRLVGERAGLLPQS